MKGEFSGDADLQVDGEVEGSIRLEESSVNVGTHGRVTASIEAREIIVQGVVRGNMHGRERVLLGRASRVFGDIETDRLIMEEGARFRGKVKMPRGEEKRNSRPATKSSETASHRPEMVPATEGVR